MDGEKVMQETPEERRTLRLEKDRIRTAAARQNETPEQRAERLRKNRERTAVRRKMESELKRAMRLEKQRLRTARSRESETPAKRAKRLDEQRIRVARMRERQSEEERSRRLEYQRSRSLLNWRMKKVLKQGENGDFTEQTDGAVQTLQQRRERLHNIIAKCASVAESSDNDKSYVTVK